MQVMKIRVRPYFMLFQIFIFSVVGFHLRFFTYLFTFSGTYEGFRTSIENINETTITYSTRAPIVFNCPDRYKVSFTFDDGPHPIYTSLVTRTLRQQGIRADFFVLSTSIQSFLSANNNLHVNQFEGPRLGFLLLQDYSSLENLLEGHDIYLHG